MTDKEAPMCPLVKEGGGSVVCPAGLAVPIGTVLARRTLRSVAILVITGFLITCANLLWTAHVVQADDRARCGTVVADASIPLSAGPSRQWEAAFEATARQRARQLGCGGG